MRLVNSENVRNIKSSYATGLTHGQFLPAVYVVEPTSRCSVNCIMCPQSTLTEGLLGEMSLNTIEKITASISSVAELVMLYFMGEPLQHPSFDDLLSIARKNIRGSLVISTNGMLLTESKAVSMIENRLDLVICCIDRWDRQAYERIRRGAGFDIVVKNTERLLEIRGKRKHPKIIVKALDIAMGNAEREEFIDYWIQRGAVPLVGWIDTWAGQFPSLAKLSGTSAPYAKKQRVACADLWFKMVINWSGQAVLCCHNYDYSFPLGEVDSPQSLLKVWHSEKLRALRHSHLTEHFSCTRLCEGCREWGEINELDVYTQLKQEEFSLVF